MAFIPDQTVLLRSDPVGALVVIHPKTENARKERLPIQDQKSPLHPHLVVALGVLAKVTNAMRNVPLTQVQNMPRPVGLLGFREIAGFVLEWLLELLKITYRCYLRLHRLGLCPWHRTMVGK